MTRAATTARTRTLTAAIRLAGTGIHSGVACAISVFPEEPGHGIVFSRKGKAARVAAHWSRADAEASDRRTVLVGEDGTRFEQIEHLMAALAAAGVTDALVEQDGPEVPFLGGGSKEFLQAIRDTGIEKTGGTLPVLTIDRPTSLRDGNALLVATPHDGLRLSCFVEFPGTIVGSQGFTLELDEESFFREAAAARTFALARDLEMLRQMGLIKGGNLGNAVVFDENRYHNESLHFPDEVVRHKIIDLIGDLALTGRPLRGHFWAWRAGHRSHVRFVQHLAKEYSLDPCSP